MNGQTKQATTRRFEDRTRFNWGYHDARFDIEHHLTNRETIRVGTIAQDGNRPLPWEDKAYVAGYSRGWESDLNNPGHALSTWAWEAEKDSRA